MSKSSGKGLFGGKTHGTITVIDGRFHRSSARNAKVAFYLTGIIVGLLVAAVATDRMHPIAALFVGALVGIPVGAVVWTVVRIWPILRLIWWWLPEIVLSTGAIYGWTILAMATSPAVMVAVLAVVLGVPAAVRPVRQRITALAWCLIVRHRLRTCFAQFITANRSGSLPLIGIAYPTPIGERVTIWLRPGLSIKDLESRLDKLAVGCSAATVTVEKASETNAARVRLDIKRRQVLTGDVASPLVDLVPDPTGDNAEKGTDGLRTLVAVPTALDLPDVIKPATPVDNGKANGHKPNGNGRRSTSTNGGDATTNGSAISSANGVDDVADWI
nr:hypothetical protein [Virgisporangium ochraceum]